MSHHSPYPQSSTRRDPWSRLAGLAAVLALALPALAADPTPIRSIGEFWALPESAKQQPVPLDLECDVTYYDDEWNALWVQDRTDAAYVDPGPTPLPIKSGQRIRVTGINPPGSNLHFANATFVILGPATTEPLPLVGRVHQVDRYKDRLVVVEAMVGRGVPPVSGHQRYALSIEGRPGLAWLRLAPGESPPDLAHSHVRITGVYNAGLDPTGALAELTLMVASRDRIELVSHLGEDPRFDLPRTPIHALPSLPTNVRVRISGTVIAQEPGLSIQLRDESGQIELHNAQTILCPLGSMVEAIGFPRILGTIWQLHDPVYRPVAGFSAQPAPLDPDQPLRLAAQVAELPAEAAAAGRPVRLSGIVTWSHPSAPFFFVQDASGAVQVFRGTATSPLRAPGRRVEIVGRTRLGPFAPAVEANEFNKIGETVPPPAPLITLQHALTGAAEARFVEMRGYVRVVRSDDTWHHLTVATADGDFTARLAATDTLGPVLDSVVRLRGVCSATSDEHRRLSDIVLLLPGPDAIQIAEPALPDRFARPLHPVATLGRSGSIQNHEHRIAVRGLVTHQEPGVAIQIIEEGAALLLLCRDHTAYLPGTAVEAVGFLGRHGQRLALHEAAVRAIGRGELPAPTPLDLQAPLDSGQVGQLVAAQATLIAMADAGDALRLTLQQGNAIAEAFLVSSGAHPPWKIGSTVALVAVYDLQYDTYQRPSLRRLHLRSPADVVVVREPPWFTRDRVLAVAGVLALGILLIAAWVGLLRRRLRTQTAQIRRQLEREAHLEAELVRTSKLESLGLLAGGIAHDFNNLLTVVMGNLSLVRDAPHLDPDSLACLEQAEGAVTRSHDLTMQLLTFAKGGNPVRAAVSLAGVVQEVARFALHGSNVSVEFAIAPDLWPAEVDKGQISQVVQNIVINAVQAMPHGGRVAIELANETVPAGDRLLAAGRYVRLSVADNGPGIPPEAIPKVFDPYFTTKKSGHGIGLATVHSIVTKHQGHITVSSSLGAGSTFRIWLPASDHAPAPEPVVPPAAASPPRCSSGSDSKPWPSPTAPRPSASTARRSHTAPVSTSSFSTSPFRAASAARRRSANSSSSTRRSAPSSPAATPTIRCSPTTSRTGSRAWSRSPTSSPTSPSSSTSSSAPRRRNLRFATHGVRRRKPPRRATAAPETRCPTSPAF